MQPVLVHELEQDMSAENANMRTGAKKMPTCADDKWHARTSDLMRDAITMSIDLSDMPVYKFAAEDTTH